MMRKLSALVLVVVFGSVAVRAQHAPRVIVKGPEVEKRTTVVMESYDWRSSLEDLKEKARKTGKLVFWLQIVGELDDGL